MQPTTKNINISQQYQMNSTQRLVQATTSGVHNTAAELIKGAIIQGEVIDLRDTAIQLLMSNGQTMKGTIDNMIPLSIGQKASFLVEDTSSKIVLKLVPDAQNLTSDATVDKALEEAMLPKNEKNISIVNELLKYGMSIDKSSIQNMLRASISFKGVSIETLAIMNKYQLPMTETNATQLEAYRNYEFRLLAQGNQLCRTLSDAITSSVSSDAMLKDLISLFPDDVHSLPTASEAGSETSVPVISDSTMDSSPLLKSEESSVHPPVDLKAESEVLVPNTLDTANEAKEANMPDVTNREDLPSPTTHTKELHPVASLITSLLKKDFSLPLEDLNKEKSISHFYDKMEKDLSKINSFLQEHATQFTKEQNESLSSQTAQIKDNLDFMKTINQMFSYVQLPVKLPEHEVHSELFVYTNKKKLQSGSNEVSVLLHLDMTHLGPLDFHLALKNNHVNAKISMPEESSLNLMKEHLPELEQALKSKGYEMTATFEKLEKETRVVRDYFEHGSDSILMKRYTFDKRA